MKWCLFCRKLKGGIADFVFAKNEDKFDFVRSNFLKKWRKFAEFHFAKMKDDFEFVRSNFEEVT